MAHSHDPASWFAPPDDELDYERLDHEEIDTAEEIEATDEDFVDEDLEYACGHEDHYSYASSAPPSTEAPAPTRGGEDDGWVLESVQEDGSEEEPAVEAPVAGGVEALDEPAWALGDLDPGEADLETRQHEPLLGRFEEPEPEAAEEYGEQEWGAEPAAGYESEPEEEQEWEAEPAAGYESEEEEQEWEAEPAAGYESEEEEQEWEAEPAAGYESEEEEREWEAESEWPGSGEEQINQETRTQAAASRQSREPQVESSRVVRARVAGMQARGMAWAIDGAILTAAALITLLIAGLVAGTGGAVSGTLGDFAMALPAAAMAALMGAVYSAVSIALLGRTIGGGLAGVRILDGHGDTPDPLRAGLRGLIAAVGVLALGAGLVWVLIDERGQTLHDRLSGTFAVES